MARKISHEDSRAIDLLLDRAANGRGETVESVAGSVHVKSSKANIRSRLVAAERVLKLLDNLPAVEPPADLVQRTLARVEESPMSIHPGTQQFPFTGTSRPHA